METRALLWGVQLELRQEGFASGMGQRSNGAAMKDVPSILSTVAFALDMGQRSGAKCSAVTVAIRRLFSEGESATSPRCIL